MDTTHNVCSPAAALPLWQTTVVGYDSSDYQTAEPSQDFLDMLDSEVGDTVEIIECAMDNSRDNSPDRPKMYPQKLY